MSCTFVVNIDGGTAVPNANTPSKNWDAKRISVIKVVINKMTKKHTKFEFGFRSIAVHTVVLHELQAPQALQILVQNILCHSNYE